MSFSVDEIQRCACLVRITGPDPKGVKFKNRAFYVATDSGYTTLSASGFAFHKRTGRNSPVNTDEAFVMASGSLVASFRDMGDDGNSPSDKLIPRCSVDMCTENGKWFKLELEKVITIDGIKEAAETLISGPISTVRGIHVGSIALFRVVKDPSITLELPGVEFQPGRSARKGDKMMIISSPFGIVSPNVFQNSVTTGVLSNLVPFPKMRQNNDFPPALLLTDARCLPGSEGAPAFDKNGALIGIVCPTLHRGENFTVELGAIIPIDLLVDEIEMRMDEKSMITNNRMNMGSPASAFKSSSDIINTPDTSFSLAVRKSSAAVVLIRVRSAWGSGIVVSSEGHIITCAHLVRPFMMNVDGNLKLRQGIRIKVSFRDAAAKPDFECGASLLFCSKGAVDVALLKVDLNFKANAIRLPNPDKMLRAGQPCIASGHALFDPSSKLTSTVSAGVISRVVNYPRRDEPAILQTCASVFRGHSGGLLADERGNLLGMLTSNARHSNGNIIPTINFCIPVNVLRPLISVCTDDRMENKISVYESFDAVDQELGALWKLEVGDSPPEPSVPKELIQQGSRFAEFLTKMGSKL